jgi:hypothetical protein
VEPVIVLSLWVLAFGLFFFALGWCARAAFSRRRRHSNTYREAMRVLSKGNTSDLLSRRHSRTLPDGGISSTGRR